METEGKEMEERALTILPRAREIRVIDNDTMASANAFLVNVIKPAKKEISDYFDPIIKKAHAVHKDLTSKKADLIRPLEEAEEKIKVSVKSYLREVEEIRLTEERRLQEEMRKGEEEKLLAEAEKLQSEGKTEEADAVLEKPIEVVTPRVVIETPKVDMRAFKKSWKWAVVDFASIPNEFKITDDVKINGIVRAMKDATNIPGIKVYEE